MIEIAELVDTTPSPLWPLLPQIGVNNVVSLLEDGEQTHRWLTRESQDVEAQAIRVPPEGERSWELPALERLTARYAEAGLTVAVIEDTPPMDAIRLGLRERDEQIEWFCAQLRAMAAVGIPVLCYNWMPIFSWARTDTAVPARGGALATGYDEELMRTAAVPPLAELATEGPLWENLAYFLRAVVPVAEEVGVRLAMHPDDPPLPCVRGVGRIMGSLDAYQRLVDLVPSDANGITLCQGNFALMTDDLPTAIRCFGSQRKIFFVHFRDVRGKREQFVETFHDDGPTDMLACMRAYAEIGFEGVLRPDHVPALAGESNDRPGYSSLGRLFAVGYIAGLREAAYGTS